jgi:hypothetical protein
MPMLSPAGSLPRPNPGSSWLNTKLVGLVAYLSDLFNKAEAYRRPVSRELVLDLVCPAAQVEGDAPTAPADPLLTDLLQQWETEHP